MTQLLRLGRFATAWWLTALITSALVTSLNFFDLSKRLDDIAYDVVRYFYSRDPDPRILLVNIDNQSLSAIGRWPWRRSVHASLVKRITSGQPRAIIYDVLFLEPDEGDGELAAAIAEAGNVYIPLLLETTGPIMPVRPIRDAAAGLGHVNLHKDADGVVRDIDLVELNGNVSYSHLILGPALKVIDKTLLAKASKQQYLIPYAGRAGTFQSISATALLSGEIPENLLRNRLIIVGATAEGLGDNHVMASNGKGLLSGIELQANALDGLINGIIDVEAGLVARIFFSLIPSWLLLLGFRFLKPNCTLPALILLSVTWLTASFLLLTLLGLWFSPVAAFIGLIFAYPFWAWRRLAAISRHMVRELDQLRSDTDAPAPFTGKRLNDDPIMRETALLSDAVSELRSMRYFLFRSLNQLPDAVFVTDRAGNIILHNERAKQISRTLESSEGNAGIGAVFDGLMPTQSRAEAGPWPPSGDEVAQEMLSRDGRTYDVRIAKYRNHSDCFDGWIIRFSDISDVRIAQRQRDEMLDFLTHDMRAPQIAILTLTAAADDRAIEPYLAERIDHYARRTLDLADDVVHLARAETLRYEPVPLDLAMILIEAIEELWPQITARKISVDKSGIEGEEYLVAGEPTLLMRALINLIDNAVKYGREGGRIRCEIVRYDTETGPEVRCSVSDNGIGIAPGRLESMFERFRRETTLSSPSGAGLGLSFVQTVVTRHGGRIVCNSKADEGSEFSIILPLINGATSIREAAQVAVDSGGWQSETTSDGQ